ncbi:MAG: hypothetical protein CM15mP68_1110 [Pseudomonadota bacterium]|nr:MAG: hypothetical protein CM15mP68_1110 [Pseudomonadota bacterium]
MSDPYILVLYIRAAADAKPALHIARGIDKVAGIDARIRTVPPVSSVVERTAAAVPDEGLFFAAKRIYAIAAAWH